MFRRKRGYTGRTMGKVTKLNLEDASVGPTRRLHLRDIQDDNPEPRGTTGAQMHAARLSLGEDISDVAGQLRIRRDQIEAIEGGDFDALPGRAYSIGFVRSYAEYLGLDQVEMVAAFKSEFDAAKSAGPELVFPDAEEESRMPRGAFVVVGILAIAALYGIWSLTVSADRTVEQRVSGAPSVIPETRVVPIV
ncbi:MAG: helix-turn-helix domain-containing protein, partial [Candidatus Phaeomarinobacter sp.]